MVMRPSVLVLCMALAGSSCTITEMPLSHTNPLDTIYDNTELRMVLTGKSTSSTTATMTWADAYHKVDGQTTDDRLKLQSSAQLLYKTGSVTSDDVAKLKDGSLAAGVNGYSSVYSITAIGGSYSGTYAATSPQNKGTYVIRFNYKYTSKADVTTSGTFFSNFVVLE